jgi:thiamine monophosphate kinase
MTAGAKDLRYALIGGEDYELLFALRPRDRGRLVKIQRRLGVAVAKIGRCVTPRAGITVLDRHGALRSLSTAGYDHFRDKR